MKALVSKDEIKKYAEHYPNFYDCPPFVFVEVQPVLTEEAAKRLMAALKRRTKSKDKANKPKLNTNRV
jgi:hypothetical protein